jgi:hypothetical protein
MPGNWAFILITTILLMATQACTREADSESAKQDVTLGDLKETFSQLTSEIAAYSFEQRDEALETAKKELKEIDAKIDALAKSAEIESQELSSDVRKQQAKLMRELKARRSQISEMTQRLSKSSAGAWNEIRDGLNNAYGDLEEALEKARAEFAAAETSSGENGGAY